MKTKIEKLDLDDLNEIAPEATVLVLAKRLNELIQAHNDSLEGKEGNPFDSVMEWYKDPTPPEGKEECTPFCGKCDHYHLPEERCGTCEICKPKECEHEWSERTTTCGRCGESRVTTTTTPDLISKKADWEEEFDIMVQEKFTTNPQIKYFIRGLLAKQKKEVKEIIEQLYVKVISNPNIFDDILSKLESLK